MMMLFIKFRVLMVKNCIYPHIHWYFLHSCKLEYIRKIIYLLVITFQFLIHEHHFVGYRTSVWLLHVFIDNFPSNRLSLLLKALGKHSKWHILSF